MIQNGYVPRVEYGARYEPEGTVIHGAGQDIDGFLDYSRALGPGLEPAMYMTYVSITQGHDSVVSWGRRVRDELERIGSPTVIPQIGLNMAGGKDSGKGRDGAVARGEVDANIEAFCDAVASFDRPVFVRIGYEFEGSWNGYDPETFPDAWIRITKALRERGLPAATVWCCAGASSGPIPVEQLIAFYPGDAWVDWWGIDLFNADEALSDHTAEFLDQAGQHGKPVMIGEATPRYVGVLDGKKSWDEWFAPFFELVATRPEIKAISYINWEWSEWSDKLGFGWHDWGDARIERNETVLDAYRAAISSELFAHDARHGVR